MGARVRCQEQTSILRRLPILGDLVYLPRGDWRTGPTRTTLVNAPDAAQDHAWHNAGAVPLVSPQWLAVLELAEEPQMLAAMHGKWRNRLRAAMRGPLTLHSSPFCPNKHDWLLQHEARQREKRRYTALPHAVLQHLPTDQTLLIQACLNGTPVAAMLFILHAPGASYHIGWSGRDGRAHHAHNLILWHAARNLRRRGVTMLELGTLDSKHTPGLTRFKLGSGAKPVKLGFTWLFLPGLSPLIRTIRRWGGIPSGLFRKGSIGGPRTSQDTPHGSAQHRHYRPR